MKRRAVRYRYRSAITGHFVTKAFALRRPRVVVRERIKVKAAA